MFPRPSTLCRFAAWLPAALYLSTVALLGRRAVGDGYDGVGFVLALDRIDLARFQPQPPGYPLLVLLGRLIHACGVPAATAVSLISAVLFAAGIGVSAGALRRLAGSTTSALWALLLALSPLCWALGIATLSDGAGLGALLLAVGSLSSDTPAGRRSAGLLCALALGLRPPYAPLICMLLAGSWMWQGWRKTLQICPYLLLGTLLWLVPFAGYIGFGTLWHLTAAHLSGHFTTFGGPAVAEPESGARLLGLLQGLSQSALGPCALPAAILCLLALRIRPPRQLPASCLRLARYALAALGAYCTWTALALSVRGSGRHLLPAVVLLLLLLALFIGQALEREGQGRARAILAAGVALLCIGLGMSSARSIWAFRQPSPGAALAEHVARHHPRGTLLYGAIAARFLDLHWGSGSAHQTRYFGDITVEAEHMDRLPPEVLLTSEVQAASDHHLRTVAQFCFDPRLPGTLRFESYPSGCVELRSYRFER